MKRWIAAIVIIAGVCPVVRAGNTGTVSFNPPLVIIDPAVDPTMFTVELAITELLDLDRYNSFNVIVGSNDGLQITGFTFDGSLPTGDIQNYEIPDPEEAYLSSIKINYFLSIPTLPILSDFLLEGQVLGGLMVDATGLAPGDYYLLIDSEMDGSRSFVTNTNIPDTDHLSGFGIVRIIPEPATLALLGLGAVGLIRRKRLEVAA